MIGSLLNFTFFILLWQPLGLSKHWLQKALQSRWSVTGDHLITILPVHSWDFPGSHHSVFTGDFLYRNLFRSDSKSQIAVSVILCYGDARVQGADRRSLFNKGIYYSISLGYKNIGRVEEASSRLRDQKWSADHRTELWVFLLRWGECLPVGKLSPWLLLQSHAGGTYARRALLHSRRLCSLPQV